MAEVWVEQLVGRVWRRTLGLNLQEAEKSRDAILEGIVECEERLERIARSTGELHESQEMVAEVIRRHNVAAFSRCFTEEGEVARQRRWRDMMNRVDDLTDEIEDLEEEENEVIKRREQLREIALESARKIRGLRLQARSIGHGGAGPANSRPGTSQGRTEAGGQEKDSEEHPDTDWEDA